jgi:hypothetical protein
MKKFVILPVLFSVLFLGGCSGYYSQDQVSKLIQQQTAASQAEINALKQQTVELQNKVNNLTPSASTTTGQIVGNDRDAHGCIGSAGYSWCEAKQKCLRPWEETCTTTPVIADQTANTSGSVSAISVAGMKQFIDSKFGFSFWYPAAWRIETTWNVKQGAINNSSDNTYAGGTIIKNVTVYPANSLEGIAIEEFVSADKSIRDNSGCGPAEGCPSAVRYYFNSSTHKWMEDSYFEYGQGNSETAPTETGEANISNNSMGGLHVFNGNARFGDNVIVPLSAKNFLIVHNVNVGTNQVGLLANTILALNPAVATPVSADQQIKSIKAEITSYGAFNYGSFDNGSDPGIKDWLTFNDKNLNYQFEYPKGFFQNAGNPLTVKILNCDVKNFVANCYTDKSKGAPFVNKVMKEMGGQQFCYEVFDDVAAGSVFTNYDYVNVKGDKCSDLNMVVQTQNCDNYSNLSDSETCKDHNTKVVPQTLSRLELSFSSK